MEEINGFLLLDKDNEISSNSALYPLKKLLPKKYKIGHTGTLDPNATGLLVVALGRATKFIDYLKNKEKTYLAELEFGKKTDTGDIWGKILEKKHLIISEEKFQKALNSFVGEIKQVPPMYSALKKNGKPLYKYAREGIELARETRNIKIFSIESVSFSFPKAKIKIRCSKGTYIRTLIEDIALFLGTVATMTALIRENSDGFSLENADKISRFLSIKDIKDKVLDIEKAFSDLNIVEVNKNVRKKLKDGIKIPLEDYTDLKTEKGDLLKLYSEGEFSALIKNDGKRLVVEKWV